jgi:Ca2+-binding EF-hand superfamily protein
MAFDRLQDERGRWEKDISHEDCRYLTRDEVLAVLRADLGHQRETVTATGQGGGPTMTEDVAKALKQQFEALDADGNGVLTRKEFPGSDQQFAQADKDKDGKLTMAEFAASEVGQRYLRTVNQDRKEPHVRTTPESLAVQRLAWLARFDPDHDGKVTRAEWTGTEQAFLTLDLDGNGVLDKLDLAAARAAAPPVPPPLPEWRGELPGVDEWCKRFDRDGDGKISGHEFDRAKELLPFLPLFDEDKDQALDKKELQKLHDALQKRRADQAALQKRPQPYAVPFDEWDKDKNGRIELSEWMGPRQLFDRIDKNRDAAITRDELLRYIRRVTGEDFFARFDLNGDGKVTREEFGGPEAAFQRADRNGDGVISKADR